MRSAHLKIPIILAAALGAALTAFPQSGRVRPSATPAPIPRPQAEVSPSPTPYPSPTPVSEVKPDADEVILVRSDVVLVPVTVVDGLGIPVTGLGVEDFILTIDGTQVEIGDMSISKSPVRLAMLFDNSSSVTVAREFEKRAAIGFFRKVLRPEADQAALFSVSTVSRLEQGLTDDVSRLVAAIERFPSPVGLTALLDGLVNASDYLRKSATGRRVIVVVSDGEDTGSETGFDATLRALQMANIQVFVVKTTDYENFKRTASRQGNANTKQLTAERRMQEIARQTGGAVYSPLDDDELDVAFQQIIGEIADQYLISYFPDSQSDKGTKFRALAIRVRDRPDLIVRARIGYYGPR
jgi:Ca-activated chloride channel family protein